MMWMKVVFKSERVIPLGYRMNMRLKDSICVMLHFAPHTLCMIQTKSFKECEIVFMIRKCEEPDITEHIFFNWRRVREFTRPFLQSKNWQWYPKKVLTLNPVGLTHPTKATSIAFYTVYYQMTLLTCLYISFYNFAFSFLMGILYNDIFKFTINVTTIDCFYDDDFISIIDIIINIFWINFVY